MEKQANLNSEQLKKNRNKAEKIFRMYAHENTEQELKDVSRQKLDDIRFTNCASVFNRDMKDTKCARCAKVTKEICTFISNEKIEAEKAEKINSKRVKKARDKYNFFVDSAHSRLAEMLSKNALTMKEVKSVLKNTYYDIVNKRSDVFAREKIGKSTYFFVIDSIAHSQVKIMKEELKKAQASASK